jgi:hypothetical protein
VVVRPHNDGIVRQRQLGDFLYAELLHTIGAYRIAREKFAELEADTVSENAERAATPADVALVEACRHAITCNKGLQLDLHKPGAPRHPSPASEEFSLNVPLLESIADFYNTVIAALKYESPSKTNSELEGAEEVDKDEEAPPAPPGERLRELLTVVHDPQRRRDGSHRQEALLRPGRIARMEERRQGVEELLPEDARRREGSSEEGVTAETFTTLLEDYIQQEGSLHVTVLRAMNEAHRWMHVAEHLRRQSFGGMFSEVPDTHARIQRMLRYSMVLNTFVFVAAQIAPWIYAEDDVERNLLTENAVALRENCDRLTPNYCMWIATQFSLLALHRRAFTSWTMGKPDRAYRDFHKLTRRLRRLSEPARTRAVRVPGTNTFIAGVSAMAELHIGRIYRGQHAHKMALRYFKRSSRHMEGWEDHEDIGEIITNSQWRINGLMNVAKAHYELGSIKHCLLGYIKAWKAFLRLAESESHATANTDVVNEFIGWLEKIVDEPEMSRVELRRRIEPLVEQFKTLRSPRHLERLAADIVGRIGHILYVLKLPPAGWDRTKEESPNTDHDLAYECVVKAAHLDPTSTLIGADLLKIEAAVPIERNIKPPPATDLKEQWPSGGGRFDEAARIVEYALQSWLAAQQIEEEKARSAERKKQDEENARRAESGGEAPAPATAKSEEEDKKDEAEKQVARKLLNSYLAHTDSSNMKLTQVYRYLMQEMRAKKRRTDPDQQTLDLICLRRYSSFFPFLPRPSAFRAPGGGYFVHVREPGEEEKPFGIAIDPGPDFIENLYRCGYGLADLHMIVITHDHADHIASLDALLALMGYRRGLGDNTFEPNERRLAIVGNESVVNRYEFYDPPQGKPARTRDAVTPLGFEEIARITRLSPSRRRRDRVGKRLLPMPNTLRIEPVRSWGHKDGAGHVSQAFQLSLGRGKATSTILFTGDTGDPDSDEDEIDEIEERFAAGEKTVFEAAGEADVVVAHLSAVPLKELRELAGLKRGEDEPPVIGEFTDLWQTACKQAEGPGQKRDTDLEEGREQAAFLLRQLQFGFRSRPRDDTGSGLGVSPFSYLDEIRKQPEQHLYLNGVLKVAQQMNKSPRWRGPERPPPLLLIGELREELGTFRTRIAARISKAIFLRDTGQPAPVALTADIGLRVRLGRHAKRNANGGGGGQGEASLETTVLCTTCDLDNDLVPEERFHQPHDIREVCVKGEDEGVFYNCLPHDPGRQAENTWLESVERYDPFGD